MFAQGRRSDNTVRPITQIDVQRVRELSGLYGRRGNSKLRKSDSHDQHTLFFNQVV